MPYTMEDFRRQYVKDHFPRLTPEELREVLESFPIEERLAGLTREHIMQYLDALNASRPAHRGGTRSPLPADRVRRRS